MRRLRIAGLGVLVVLLTANALSALSQSTPYQYIRAGENANISVQPRPGLALMGGGTDLDEAFRFLCDRASGGDMLVLRATGDDDYNPYLRGLCHLNSVATLIIQIGRASC